MTKAILKNTYKTSCSYHGKIVLLRFKGDMMENHNFENEGQFNRQMNSRHLQMLSIGGVIGTGLFLSSGYAINQAGPFGAILSYLFGGVMVYLVMFSLGELSVAMPVTGSFHTYATR